MQVVDGQAHRQILVGVEPEVGQKVLSLLIAVRAIAAPLFRGGSEIVGQGEGVNVLGASCDQEIEHSLLA